MCALCVCVVDQAAVAEAAGLRAELAEADFEYRSQGERGIALEQEVRRLHSETVSLKATVQVCVCACVRSWACAYLQLCACWPLRTWCV